MCDFNQSEQFSALCAVAFGYHDIIHWQVSIGIIMQGHGEWVWHNTEHYEFFWLLIGHAHFYYTVTNHFKDFSAVLLKHLINIIVFPVIKVPTLQPPQHTNTHHCYIIILACPFITQAGESAFTLVGALMLLWSWWGQGTFSERCRRCWCGIFVST